MKAVVTGGAGFIGTNLIVSLLDRGDSVVLYDNLSRLGVRENLAYLEGRDSLEVVLGDVRDYGRLREAVEGADILYHLAAQVAVTASIANPREDFEVNALGTLNVLEAARCGNHPIVLYASTNKVYGQDSGLCTDERQPLDLCSPYGCSKGAGDQYVRDYCRTYGVPTVVFRQSCIYGPRQFGMADQGWLSWLATAAYRDLPITIYGDGNQIRDVLYIDDLVEAFDQAVESIETTRGQVYNIGGGPENILSLLDWIRLLEARLGRPVRYELAEWRTGDQRVYVSDISKARRDFGWQPRTSKEEGFAKLLQWVAER